MNQTHNIYHQLDQDGHLLDYKKWNPTLAQCLADNLSIQLTDWHFNILFALRQFYQDYGYAPATRPMIKYLMKTLDSEISNQMLMERFNTGLVARHISRLAGLPKPPNCL